LRKANTSSFVPCTVDGNDAGQGYSVPVGTDVMRDHHLTVQGTKEEVLAFLKSLLGGA